jgi:hypothetical protein
VHLEESLKRKSFWPEGILFWSRWESPNIH